MSPSVRGWVQDRFGTADETLLSTDVYSNQELRKDKVKLERQRKRLENDMEDHRQQYKQLVRKAAGSDEMKKRTLAKKAKFEKKKYKLKEKKHQEASVKFGTILSIEGARDLLEEQDATHSPDLSIDNVMSQDVEPGEFQAKIEEKMVQFDMEMETMQEVQSSLDFDFMSTDMSMGDNDDVLGEIEDLEKGNLDEEELDIGEDSDSSSVSASAEVEVEVDDDFDDIELEDEGMGL
jgi:hypothetical protein